MDAKISIDVREARAAASRLDVAVVNYGMGNLRSVVHALEYLGCTPRVGSKAEDFETCDAIILPGVGAFGEAMANLKQQELVEPLGQVVFERATPFLGICLGMQLLARTSEEHGRHDGLGWVDAEVCYVPQESGRVPHVGWSSIRCEPDDPLFANIEAGSSFYFDHSLYMIANGNTRVGWVDYGQPMVAALSKDNIFATQFHPEKSQRSGLKLLRNFLNISAREAGKTA